MKFKFTNPFKRDPEKVALKKQEKAEKRSLKQFNNIKKAMEKDGYLEGLIVGHVFEHHVGAVDKHAEELDDAGLLDNINECQLLLDEAEVDVDLAEAIMNGDDKPLRGFGCSN